MDSFGSIFLWVGTAGCISMLLMGGLIYTMYKRSKRIETVRLAVQSWPSTSGKVLKSSVERNAHQTGVSLEAVVVYQYEVDGKTYQSQNIKAGNQFMVVVASGQEQAIVARYPVGANVTVYYDPNNPAECALEK